MGYDENSKQELNNEEDSEPVIKESSAPKLKRKLKKLGEVVLFSLIGAVIFGAVSRYVFTVSEGPINKILGIENDKNTDKNTNSGQTKNNTGSNSVTGTENNNGVTGDTGENRNVVTLTVNKQDDITITAAPEKNEKNTDGSVPTQVTDGATAVYSTPTEDDAKNTAAPEVNPVVDTDLTGEGKEAVPTKTPTTTSVPVSSGDGNGDDKGSSVSQYLNVYDELREIANTTQKSLVTVRSHKQSVNWMGETVETTTDTFGALIADNGVEYFVATYYDGTISADSLSVILCTGSEYQATFWERDSRYNLAILAIPMNAVSSEDRAAIRMLVCGDSDDVFSGMPIIALGSPNGTAGSLVYGFVTDSGASLAITDGRVETFTTNIAYSDRSEGIIINYEGKAVGVISRSIKNADNNDVITSVDINSMIDLAQDMCNGLVKPYVGIKVESVPTENLLEMGLESGICVMEVAASSPADQALIKKGDIIISIDGIGINSISEFMDNVVGVDSNDGIEVTLRRNGMDQTVLLIPRAQ